MPRTVPKTVAKAGGATNKRTANRKARFIKSLSPEKDQSRGIRAAVGSDQRRLGEMAARRARQPRTNRCLRKSNGGDVDRGGSYTSQWSFYDTPKGFCMQQLVKWQSHFRPLADKECASFES